jgi:hypothetical protein
LLSTIFALIAWLPLALGNQVCQYSEFNQGVAVIECSCIILGLGYIVFALIHTCRGVRRGHKL